MRSWHVSDEHDVKLMWFEWRIVAQMYMLCGVSHTIAFMSESAKHKVEQRKKNRANSSLGNLP